MTHALLRAAYTTASAEDNNSVFAQGIETSDIQNHSNYDGKAIQIGMGLGNTEGKPQANMQGAGYGTDSDSQSSTTKAAVTGMAGESDVTTATKDSLNKTLVNTFDASSVNEELGAQVEITRAFGQEAPKAVGDYAGNKQVELLRQGKFEEADKWAEDGVYRVALHTLVGALATGSIDGAVASGTTAVSVPALDNYLKEQGLDDTAREAVLLGFSASVGASIGGDTASTVSSFNQTDNNYLSHKQMQEWIDALKKTGSDPRRREQINSFYLKLDREQQADFINDCETNYNYQRCAEHVKRFHEGNTYKGNTLFDPNLYSKIEELGKLETGYLKNTVTSHNDYVFRNNSRWEGEAAYRQDGVLGAIAQGAVGVGASRIPKVTMLGSKGTQISSKTVWKQKGSKARIDVENPNPGQRPGQVHYQDANNNKYYYNPADGKFYTGKISDGVVAPKAVQNLLKDDDFKSA